MKIDSHAHGNLDRLETPLPEYIQQCRDRGVDRVVHIAAPQDVLETHQKCGDFTIPVAFIDIDTATPEQVATHIQQGCLGIKLIRPQAPHSDARYQPIYDTISQLGVVAVFHTGYLMRSAQPDPITDITHMRPAHLDTVVRRFPSLKVLMAHFGNPWWEEAWKVAWSNPNIYADLSGGTAIVRSLSMWREMFAPNGQLHAASFSKLCFGSDVSYFGCGFGFERYMVFYEQLYDAVSAPEALRQQVDRGNILSLFGLE